MKGKMKPKRQEDHLKWWRTKVLWAAKLYMPDQLQ